MRKFQLLLSALVLMAMIPTLTTATAALDQGAYSVYAGSNYWNPDTGEIDDGGTANAALGDGMSRSVTGTTALVEREGDNYYVTIRLLLQSSTYDAQFWTRTGYNSYEAVSYDMMAENAVTDSIDYRFAVADPFQPIRASMYVVPMGRDTTWYIQLDETTATSDTGDFIVSVQAVPLPEEETAEEESLDELEEETLPLTEEETEVEDTAEEIEAETELDLDIHLEELVEALPQLEELEAEDDTLPLEEAPTQEERLSRYLRHEFAIVGLVVLALITAVLVRNRLRGKK